MFSLYEVRCSSALKLEQKSPLSESSRFDTKIGPSYFHIYTNSISKIEELISEDLKKEIWFDKKVFFIHSTNITIESVKKIGLPIIIDMEFLEE